MSGENKQDAPLVHQRVPENRLSSLLLGWLGDTVSYARVKAFLESTYRSPAGMHLAHKNAIEYFDGIIRDLKTIAQASARLQEKEAFVQELLQEIAQPVQQLTAAEQESLDTLIRRYATVQLDANDEISRSVESTSEYVVSKMVITFGEGLAVSKPDRPTVIDVASLFERRFVNPNDNGVTKELCKSIYADYLSSKELLLPALQMFIYMDTRVSDGGAVEDVGVLGSRSTKESKIITLWSQGKGSNWVSSLCGKVLAYMYLMGRGEDIREVLSKVKFLAEAT